MTRGAEGQPTALVIFHHTQRSDKTVTRVGGGWRAGGKGWGRAE